MREIQLNRHQKSRVINSQQLLLTRNSRPEGRGGSEDNSFVIRICWMVNVSVNYFFFFLFLFRLCFLISCALSSLVLDSTKDAWHGVSCWGFSYYNYCAINVNLFIVESNVPLGFLLLAFEAVFRRHGIESVLLSLHCEFQSLENVWCLMQWWKIEITGRESSQGNIPWGKTSVAIKLPCW